MSGADVFRVNYYVGALLAQGGNLRLEGSKIIFTPTSSLDRAMGAVDVEIPFLQILDMESRGTLSKSVHIKTKEKTHKFEGGQVQKFWDVIQKVLPSGLPANVPESAAAPDNASHSMSALSCDQCLQPVQPGYFFCPYCTHRLKCVCTSCHKAADPSWAACAFCGWKFSSTRH